MLSPDEVAKAKASLRQVLDEIPFGRNDFEGHHTRRVYALFAKTCAFDEAAINPLLLGVLDRVLGHYQLSAPTGIQIAPGEKDQVLHYDASVYPLPRDFSDVVVNTMWALDDFTVENGATRIVPGSHRWIDRRPEPGDEVLDAVMPAGSVIFYGGKVFHGGGANSTDKPRLGVILEYVSAWLVRRRRISSRFPARSPPSCPSGCRSSWDTTSIHRSSATWTDVIPVATSRERSCHDR